MPTLSNNIENRVRKLPKPCNSAQSLQPLFEAVSNAVFAMEEVSDKNAATNRIDIRVTNLSSPEKIEIMISDRGIGLDEKRYNAFCEIDTDFKQTRGGKGVGRLFWLDAFKDINVESNYLQNENINHRAFKFILSNHEQVVPQSSEGLSENTYCGTTITFKGIRTKDYATHFPKRPDTFLRYFTAHFIADFLIGKGPRIAIDLDGQLTEYPKSVTDLSVGASLIHTFQYEEYGPITIEGFTCKPEASTGHEGLHQLHLLANGRTVETRCVDKLLGVTNLERDGKNGLAFHGCVSGEYLDARVNEGRTAFNLPEQVLVKLIRSCMDIVKKNLLPVQVEKFAEERRQAYVAFVERYPTFGFEADDVQLGRVPFHAKEPEDFAAGLIKHKIRLEEDRDRQFQSIIEAIEQNKSPIDLESSISAAVKKIHKSEQLALAQHVVRRKLALELMDKLIKRYRPREGKEDDHYLERTLHSFICPMRIMGENAERTSRAHELWIIDERLAFTRAFSSDQRLDTILAKSGSSDRPDLLIWDLAFGLGVTESNASESVDVSNPLRSMMVVEFKKPQRKNYSKAEDNIEQQITKYLSQLKGGEIETFDRAKVRVADDCIFHCYVVADIVGDLEQQLSNWMTTANGQGRIRPLSNAYRGQIEVIQWQDLINDAWMRNRATLSAAGLSRNQSKS